MNTEANILHAIGDGVTVKADLHDETGEVKGFDNSVGSPRSMSVTEERNPSRIGA